MVISNGPARKRGIVHWSTNHRFKDLLRLHLPYAEQILRQFSCRTQRSSTATRTTLRSLRALRAIARQFCLLVTKRIEHGRISPYLDKRLISHIGLDIFAPKGQARQDIAICADSQRIPPGRASIPCTITGTPELGRNRKIPKIIHCDYTQPSTPLNLHASDAPGVISPLFAGQEKRVVKTFSGAMDDLDLPYNAGISKHVGELLDVAYVLG